MTINRNRKRVWREITHLGLDYKNIVDVIATLERYRAEYGDACRIQKVEHDYDNGFDYAVMCESDETGAEMMRRIAQEERWEADRAARERAEFERLKAKFGG